MGTIEFNSSNFVDHLACMGIGMLAIVIVIGAIILVTMLLNHLTRKKMTTKAKVLLGVFGLILVAALIVSLIVWDDSCKLCIKKGEYTYGEHSYCKEHYEEVSDVCNETNCDNKATYVVEHAVKDGNGEDIIVTVKYCGDHYVEHLGNLIEELD